MGWTIEFDPAARRELNKLERQAARRILDFLNLRIAALADPRSIGQALRGAKFGEFWKYRLGDYRVIVSIEDLHLLVLVVRIGNRRNIDRN